MSVWVSSLPAIVDLESMEIILLALSPVMVTTPSDEVAVTLALVSLLPTFIAAAIAAARPVASSSTTSATAATASTAATAATAAVFTSPTALPSGITSPSTYKTSATAATAATAAIASTAAAAAGAVTLIVSLSTFPRRSVPAKLLTPFHCGSLAIFTRLSESLSVLNHNSALSSAAMWN